MLLNRRTALNYLLRTNRILGPDDECDCWYDANGTVMYNNPGASGTFERGPVTPEEEAQWTDWDRQLVDAMIMRDFAWQADNYAKLKALGLLKPEGAATHEIAAELSAIVEVLVPSVETPAEPDDMRQWIVNMEHFMTAYMADTKLLLDCNGDPAEWARAFRSLNAAYRIRTS